MFNGVLGSDREHLESVQMGACTMLSTGLTQYTNFITDLTALDSPFMFESADDVYSLFADEEFVAALEERFSVTLDPADLERKDMATPAAIAETVRARQPS